MSEQEQPDDRAVDELDLEEVGAELDDLLTEIGSEDEEPKYDDYSDDGLDDGFGELASLPEVDDELDLSSADTDEPPVVAEHTDDPDSPPELPVAESMEKNMNGDPLAEVAAIAAERNAEVAKKTGGNQGRMIQLALAGVSLLALLTAGFAAWQGYSASARLEEMMLTVQALQQRLAAPGKTPVVDDSALRTELDKLVVQVNEMAATRDGVLVDLREKNDAALAVLGERLEKLEQAKAAAVSAPATKSLVEKTPVTPATVAPSGGWSVNLISLSNEQTADEELARLRNLGIRAEKQRVEQDGRVWFRLRVPGFTSHDGAKAYIDTVESRAGLSNAWVGKD